MARKIDFENVSADDVPYLLQRPWIAADILHQGFTLPEEWYEAKNIPVPQPIPVTHVDDAASVAAGANLSDEEEVDDEEDFEDDYDSLTKEDLRVLLQSRELPHTGNKQELIDRLREDDELEEEDEDEDEEEDES